MSMAQYSAVTAAALFADHLWTKPVLSSESLDWPNVIARRYLNCLPACVAIPPLCDDVVIITIAGTTRIDGSMSRQFSGEVGAPGSLFLTPRGTPATWIHSHTVDIFHLYLQPEFLPSIAVEAGCSSPEQTELCELLSHNDILLESLIKGLLNELTFGQSTERLYVDSLIHTLGTHLLRYYSNNIPSHSAQLRSLTHGIAPATLRRVIDYIHDNLACKLTLDTIATQANLSPYHFARLFKQSTGQPLHQYVIEQRVTSAKQLLVSGQGTVGEVAALVGFHDQSHLHRYFKRFVGVTPSAFLKQHRNIQDNRKNIQDPL